MTFPALIAVLIALASVAPSVANRLHANLLSIRAPVAFPTDPTLETAPPYDTVYHFEQLIDHDAASLGSFPQRFWFNGEFYAPGM